jgi:RNase P/RNase MRP subunit p29
VSIRGIQGRVYHCKETDNVVVIHTEGEFAGKIMKAQPISDQQLDLLRELNKLD